jgi:hypothetical protein
MRNVKWSGALAAALGWSVVACGDPLKEVDVITETRVLGARVEVVGEPERASPAPGEAVTVRWLVVAPDVEPALGWRLVACDATSGDNGVPDCAAEPFAAASADEPVVGAPTLEFVVPESTTAEALAVKGVICPDVGAADCDGDVGTNVSLDFGLVGLGGKTETVNTNPSLGVLAFDGEEWSDGSDCAKLPKVAPKSTHRITILLDEEDRDPLIPEYDVDPVRETLQISHFTDHGSFEAAFTVVEAESSELERTAVWKAPSKVPEGGVARIFIVVRDGRGGTDWATRTVCF